MMTKDERNKKKENARIYFSPIVLLGVLAASIFLIEFLVMGILYYLPHGSALFHALLDSTMLILMLSPILYFFFFRPLLLHIKERRKMEEELLKAQKLDSLGVLAGGIAHDYNNLLTAIMANISFAIQMEDPEKRVYKDNPGSDVLQSLLDAETATLQAKGLTRQLITFAKGGSPVRELVPDIGEIIKGSVGFALRGSNVRYDLSIPGDLWPVEVDTGHITQVLQNLIINADQAMPGGGVVKIKAENISTAADKVIQLKAGRYIKVSIVDEGDGIPKENLSKIFDPYFTTKEKGSGLGLATVYSIIKKHDGSISVETELGAGSTFSFYLPASEKPVKKKARKEPYAAGPMVGEGKVLVMDDEALVRKITERVLSKAGYEVKLAKDGNEAIDLYIEAKVTGRTFDAVIMDLTIPGGLGGRDTIRELLEFDPGARVIVTSGYSNDPIMEDYRKYGFKGAIVKPYNIEELRRVVHEMIEDSEGVD
jgi:signal transduction histidine kinase/CheY-like chemotaxis protein